MSRSWCHFAWSCIIVGREVNTIPTRVRYLCPKKRGLRKEKEHQPSDKEWTLILIRKLLKIYKSWFFVVWITATKFQLNVLLKSSNKFVLHQNSTKIDRMNASVTLQRDGKTILELELWSACGSVSGSVIVTEDSIMDVIITRYFSPCHQSFELARVEEHLHPSKQNCILSFFQNLFQTNLYLLLGGRYQRKKYPKP